MCVCFYSIRLHFDLPQELYQLVSDEKAKTNGTTGGKFGVNSVDKVSPFSGNDKNGKKNRKKDQKNKNNRNRGRKKHGVSGSEASGNNDSHAGNDRDNSYENIHRTIQELAWSKEAHPRHHMIVCASLISKAPNLGMYVQL